MTKRGKLVAFVLAILLFIVLKLVADQPAGIFSGILGLIASSALPFLGGFSVLFLGSLVSSSSILGRSTFVDLVRRVSAAPARNFTLGFLASAYVIIIRPVLASIVSFLMYCEWFVAVLVVYLVYSMAGFSGEEFDDSSKILNWRRHVQEVSRETGRDFSQIAGVVGQFLNQGTREPLLVYLTLYLQRLGGSDQQILDLLSPLMSFRENTAHGTRYLLARRARSKQAMKNRKARENLLEVLFDRIDRMRSE